MEHFADRQGTDVPGVPIITSSTHKHLNPSGTSAQSGLLHRMRLLLMALQQLSSLCHLSGWLFSFSFHAV
jgi:hypothetical protein